MARLQRSPKLIIPDGYILKETDTAIVLAREDVAPELIKLLLIPPWIDEDRFKDARWLEGRGAIPSIPLSDGRNVILRTYRHGGLLSGFTGNIFIGRPRPFRELTLSIAARKRNIPTPPVLGGVIYPVAGPVYRGVLAIEEIPEASDGLELLKRARDLSELQRTQLYKSILPKAGRLIALCHNNGLVHTDLNIKNIMVCPDPFSLHVIDLDRCRIEKKPLSDSQRRSQLERLFRSLKKVTLKYNLKSLGEKEIMLFLRAYSTESRQPVEKTISYFKGLRHKLDLLRGWYK